MKRWTLVLFLALSLPLFAQTTLYQASITPVTKVFSYNTMFPLSDGNTAWLDDPSFLNIVAPSGPYPYACSSITQFAVAWSSGYPSRTNPGPYPFSEFVSCAISSTQTITLSTKGTGVYKCGWRWCGVVATYTGGTVAVTQQ